MPNLPINIQLPYDKTKIESEDPKELSAYIKKLIIAMEKELRKVANVVNQKADS